MFLKKRAVAVLAGAAALSLMVAGCGSSDSGGSDAGTSGAEDGTLVAFTGQAGDYQKNFNPFSPSQIGGVGTIYEQLFFINQLSTDEFEPVLGTSYEWNEDGTELTVALREGVTFTDGEPFTADDVVFSFQLIDEYPQLDSFGWDGQVEALDEHTVKFSFDRASFVLGAQILGRQVIVPEHLWADVDPTTDIMENPVGTGAFMLDSFMPQAFTFVANPDYWGGEPELQKIRWIALSGNQAGADAVSAGTIDWLTGPIPDIQNTNKNHPQYHHLTAFSSQMVLATCSSVEMGCEGPQTDPVVRHALYNALDRTQLNNLAFEKTAAPVSPVFALTPGQDDFVTILDENQAPMTAQPAESTRLLEDAGWAKGADGIFAKDGQRLSLSVEVVTGWTDYITALDVISSQARAAGIEINVSQSSWNEWTERKVTGQFQLAIDGVHQGPQPDPYFVYQDFFHSRNGAAVGERAGNNFARFADPEVDAAIEALTAMAFDDPARQAHFDTIQQILLDEMPYIPVLNGGTTSVWNTARFEGWPTQDDLYAFPAVWSSFDNAQIYQRLSPVG
ncbi:ABC transporter substrate-binding protein [Cellulomonas sp. KH9]|uniref:ABC transporter substrate-binding protein n=1 Tax=Cellulomonas sp. KH9 TaxID=1855324 RepID=UPI0008DFCA29|nr:ABC transporter substrate-binding protein [Cellulomonas sp. KH9]SFJ68908.1 peptide/nickel transport system substrate-binding protein [Cellulomonas sp. KH9]